MLIRGVQCERRVKVEIIRNDVTHSEGIITKKCFSVSRTSVCCLVRGQFSIKVTVHPKTGKIHFPLPLAVDPLPSS